MTMRITGGQFRSRLLSAPRGLETRPTSDRVRETLFSMLASRIEMEGARVIDLFAGTGALGLEALSRGAASAVFVEIAKPALVSLRANIAALRVEACARVLAQSFSRAPLAGIPCDLLFVDPPYALYDTKEEFAAILRAVEALSWSEPGWAVFEHGKKQDLANRFAFQRPFSLMSRDIGDTTLTFLEFPGA